MRAGGGWAKQLCYTMCNLLFQKNEGCLQVEVICCNGQFANWCIGPGSLKCDVGLRNHIMVHWVFCKWAPGVSHSSLHMQWLIFLQDFQKTWEFDTTESLQVSRYSLEGPINLDVEIRALYCSSFKISSQLPKIS